MRERDVVHYLRRRVKAFGGEVRKVKWVGRKGAPDMFVMIPGRLGLWVETKAPGEAPEPHQVREHKRMRDLGQRVEVVDSCHSVEALIWGT